MTWMPAHVMKPHASTKPQAWWAACWSTCCPSDPGDRAKLPYLPVQQGCWQYLHQTCTRGAPPEHTCQRMLRQRSMQLAPGCHSKPCVPTMCEALNTRSPAEPWHDRLVRPVRKSELWRDCCQEAWKKKQKGNTTEVKNRLNDNCQEARKEIKKQKKS